MEHKDLFSGIGGFALAARMVWGEQQKPRLFCEKEQYARRVLNKNFPGVPCVEDIRNLRGDQSVTTDLVTAGFPCQPFSVAGKRAGKKDDRYLWPETLRFLQEDQPRWFIGENVPGIINMALDDVLTSLENAGYEAETLIIPACAVNAYHRRDRVWIVAYSRSSQRRAFNPPRGNDKRGNDPDGVQGRQKVSSGSKSSSQKVLADTTRQLLHGTGTARERRRGEFTNRSEWKPEPAVGRVAHGIPRRVDRLRGLGNAIVPQVAAVLMAGIKEVDRVYNNALAADQNPPREHSAA